MSFCVLSGVGSISDQLHEYVKWCHSAGPGAWIVPELIARKGSGFAPADLPTGIHQGTPNQCYSNAYHLALENGFDYVEGVIVREISPGIGIHHAWCATKDNDQAIDNTLRSSPNDIYYGIRFDNDKIYNIQEKLNYYGFLSGPIKPNYDLALTLIDLCPDIGLYMAYQKAKRKQKRRRTIATS